MKKLFLLGASALMMGAVVFTNCKKDDDVVLPPIGGFNNSNEVGAADLVAHFPCEEGKERISGAAAASSVGATYVTGAKGKCVSLVDGYVLYPAMTGLPTGKSAYSMSLWAQVKNNQGATGGNRPYMLASMTRTDHWVGNINILVESGQLLPSSDSLFVKGLVRSADATGAAVLHDNISFGGAGSNRGFRGAGDTTWTQLVLTWNPITADSSVITIYGNGTKISATEYQGRKGLGGLTFSSPTQMMIGAFPTNVPGNPTAPDAWQKPMTGKIDEVRLWKKALSPAEIEALYQLEKAGR